MSGGLGPYNTTFCSTRGRTGKAPGGWIAWADRPTPHHTTKRAAGLGGHVPEALDALRGVMTLAGPAGVGPNTFLCRRVPIEE